MVTGLVEVGRRKCHQYWPDVGKSELYGSVMVKVNKEQTQAHYTVRDITIQGKQDSIIYSKEHYSPVHVIFVHVIFLDTGNFLSFLK